MLLSTPNAPAVMQERFFVTHATPITPPTDALVFANDESTRPLSLGLYTLRNSLQYTGDWASMFAGVVIVMLPAFAI